MLKEYATELYSTYSDLKAVLIERFNRTLLHIINKPMFINGYGNGVSILNDASVTYNNNIQSTINMTPVDASHSPHKVKYLITTNKARQLFLEDNDNFDINDTYKIINTHPPIYEIMLLIKSIATITCYHPIKKRHFN